MIWFEVDNEIHHFKIPLVSEIKFSDFCDFRDGEAKYVAYEGPPAESDLLLRKALQNVITGDLHKLPAHNPGDDLKAMLEKKYQLTIGDHISLERLYISLVSLVNQYEPDHIPEVFRMKWKGQDFEIKKAPVARVITNKPITTGEAIEVLEFQRRAGDRSKTSPLGSGNVDFNLGLREMAILVRKKDEELPSSRGTRRKFIQDRMNLFKDLPLDTILSIRFFFISALLNYSRKKHFTTSGMVGQGVKKRRKAKRKKKGRRGQK